MGADVKADTRKVSQQMSISVETPGLTGTVVAGETAGSGSRGSGSPGLGWWREARRHGRGFRHRLMTAVRRFRVETGMSTAEYAVGTIAACAFAALLYKVVSSPGVRQLLSGLIDRALKLAG